MLQSRELPSHFHPGQLKTFPDSGIGRAISNSIVHGPCQTRCEYLKEVELLKPPIAVSSDGGLSPSLETAMGDADTLTPWFYPGKPEW